MSTDENDRKPTNNLRRLLRYVKPYWPYFAGATLFGQVKFLTPVAMSFITGRAVSLLQQVSKGTLAPEVAWVELKGLILVGMAIAVGSMIPTYLRSLIGARATQQVVRDLRCDLYAHIQKLSHSFFDANRSGSLTSRITSDTETVQPFLNQGLIQGWMNISVIVSILVTFVRMDWRLALLSMSFMPLHMTVNRLIGWKVKENAREIRDRLSWLAGCTQEKLAAMTVVKAFTREDDEVQRFTDDANTLIDLGIRNTQLNGLSQTFIVCLNALAPMFILLVGGSIALFHNGALDLGALVTFVLMQNQLYGPFERLNEMQLVTANALGATDRIFQIFDTEPEVADAPKAVKAPHFRGEVSFEGVTFTYPGSTRPTLRRLSLTIAPRSTMALVGPSGGGKTTVTSLLNRFYEWEDGTIRIDGRDIREYTIYSLRHQIALVPQEPILFSGTIEENIRYGKPDATEEQVHEAARRAYAHDFIMGLEDGYETMLGERGVRLSGGQKQRIAIARAFLKDPAILVLDEATSALDSESERIVQQALEALMQDRTTLVIAHRLATIRNADAIAVIKDGQVTELGSHDALVRHNGIYAKLCRQQFGRQAVSVGLS